MRTVPILLAAAAIAAPLASAVERLALLPVTGDVDRVHDPAIIREHNTYYLFATGRTPGGILPIRTSHDLRKWTLSGAVFTRLPDWATRAVPGARDAWAPDISYFNGAYHLYYSVSTFGRNNSVIGLATNQTLDPASPAYKWNDEGLVVESREGHDDWNAIDPNLVIEKSGGIWLAWGSFWSGIKMRRIEPATGKFSDQDPALYSLAARPRANPTPSPPAEGAIEAPFLFQHNGFWYLFVSVDFCCRGAKSDYNVVVGRAKRITGPYTDREGRPLMQGGGTPVIPARAASWNGAGHEAIFRDMNRDYILFHAYDPKTGRPSLQISTLKWQGGWPTASE